MRGHFVSIDKKNDPLYIRQVEPDELNQAECENNAMDLVLWLTEHAPWRTFAEVKRLFKEMD